MSDSVYSFRAGPTYRGAMPGEMLEAALDMPMSRTSTFFDQAKGGIRESFGLGTALRESELPSSAPVRPNRFEPAESFERRREEARPLPKDAYESSAYFREGVPWDAGMTDDRAAALASEFDARKVREFYAEKRPITAFIGNLAGQATDPINYIPIAGPAVRAAAVARVGKVAGASVAASLDAAANTAIFGVATAPVRAKHGDDVSWQATVSQIATAALIGAGFGAIGGALEGRAASASRRAIEERLATLKTTQEARIALNEGIDALIRGEDVRLSPNATGPLARVQQEIIAYHGTPHTFDRFSMDKIGTGEGAQSFGHGLYFAEKEGVASSYRDALAGGNTKWMEGERVLSGAEQNAAELLDRAKGDVHKAKMVIKHSLRAGRLADQKYLDETEAALDRLDPSAIRVVQDPGSLYEVGIKADRDELLDYDKPLKEQPEKVLAGLERAFGEDTIDPAFFRNSDTNTGDWLDMAAGLYAKDKKELAERLRQAGIPGIQYLDAGSRDGGDGTRNFVIFDDGRVSIRSRNGQPIDNTQARADPPPSGIDEAAKAIAKPDDYKALSSQYRVDPETGSFDEEVDIAQLGVEGRLTEDDVSTLADAQAVYDDGAAYGEALKSVAGCLI